MDTNKTNNPKKDPSSMTFNLLRTNGRLELSPELVLLVVEYTEYTPEQLKTFMTLSKSFRNILLENERSVTDRIANTQLLGYLQPAPKSHPEWACESCAARSATLRAAAVEVRTTYSSQRLMPSIISSSHANGVPLLMTFTYTWLAELFFRNQAKETLLSYSVTAMLPTSNWLIQIPTLQRAVTSLESRFLSFKKQALDLMYTLADSPAVFSNSATVRDAQEDFLQGLPAPFIALLGITAGILSSEYVIYESTTRQAEATLLQEEQLVFEDRILRYGPFFVWAYIAGSSEARHWVREEIDQGMKKLRAYENGKEAVASLQSLVGNVFCGKVGCEFADRWARMNTAVDEMLFLDVI